VISRKKKLMNCLSTTAILGFFSIERQAIERDIETSILDAGCLVLRSIGILNIELFGLCIMVTGLSIPLITLITSEMTTDWKTLEKQHKRKTCAIKEPGQLMGFLEICLKAFTEREINLVRRSVLMGKE